MSSKFKPITSLQHFLTIANCYYLHYVVIMTKKIFFPCSYYVHYALIITKRYIFILALRVLRLDHAKKNFVFSFQYHVHYAVIKKKNVSHIATTSTTFVIMTKNIFSLSLLHSLRLDQNKKIYFHFNTTPTTAWLRKIRYFSLHFGTTFTTP